MIRLYSYREFYLLKNVSVVIKEKIPRYLYAALRQEEKKNDGRTRVKSYDVLLKKYESGASTV